MVLNSSDCWSEVARANRRVGIQPEDLEERIRDGRCRCDNGSANDRELAGVHVTPANGKTARVTVAAGQTLDLSNFYVVMTSNIGSAELLNLEHSSDATLERHVLMRAQQLLRPEIFARIAEKLVFHRLSYEHQLEIAEKFLNKEIQFLRSRGFELTVDPSVLPFLVRKGFHPKLGARPMRDTVEKQVGDAAVSQLLNSRAEAGQQLIQVSGDQSGLIVT